MLNDYCNFSVKTTPYGWEFVNLFQDAVKRVYYCRLREINQSKKISDRLEVTGNGATMQIAFQNACDIARP
jgi:hypothetical protein